MTNVSPTAVTPADPAPSPPPGLASFAANLYAGMEPVAWLDASVGWALAYYCGALGGMFQDVEDLARDTPEGPGWSAVLDLDRCPDDWLPWLAQFVGVTIAPGSTPAQMRAAIDALLGFQRGTPAAIRASTAATLTGSKVVVLQERFGGDAYALAVYTLTAQTPDQAASRAAILAQKPGGIVLTYAVGNADTYQAINTAYATYAAVKAAFPDYGHMAAGIVP